MTDAAIRSLPDRASTEGRARPEAAMFGMGLGGVDPPLRYRSSLCPSAPPEDALAPVEVRAKWDRALIAAVISVDSDDVSFVAVDGKLQQSANPAPPPILRKNGEGAAATIARDA